MKKNFKYLVKAVSVLTAAALLLATPMPRTVKAAETKYEAEEADLSEAVSSGTNGESMIETNAKASGGKSIGYFSKTGNKITWTVNHDGGEVSLGFAMASGALDFMKSMETGFAQMVTEDLNLQGKVKVLVNGEEAPLIANSVLPGCGDENVFNNWKTIYVPATLKAGENKITLEMLTDAAPNIDYMEIAEAGKTNDASQGNNNQGSNQGGNQGGNPSQSVKLEAEDAQVIGTPSQEGKEFVEEVESASNGKSVGFLGVAGNKIVFKTDKMSGDVTLRFKVASAAFDFTVFGNGDMTVADNIKVLVNGKEVTFTDMTLKGGAEKYDNWTDFNVNATLNAGENEITLEMVSGTAVNVDYLEILSGHNAAGSGNSGNSGSGNSIVKLEAEKAEIVGTPSSGDHFVEDVESASGGQSVGFLGAAGNKVVFKTDKAKGDVTLRFRVASAAFSMETFGNGDMQVAGNVKILVNGKEVTFNDMKLIGGAEKYDNWTDFNVNATLNAGENEIVIEMITGTAVNVDYLEILEGHNAGGGNSGNGNGGTTVIEKEVIVEKVVKENKYVNVPTRIVKTTVQNVKDIALFSGIICAVLLVAFAIVSIIRRARMTADDKKEFARVKEEKKALKAEFSKGYKNVSGAEEKEIARYDYKLKGTEAKEKAYRNVEALTYGEGKSRAKALDIAYGKHVAAWLVGIVVVACTLGTLLGINYTGNVVIDSPAPIKAASSLIVNAYDWGAGANKLVISLPGTVKAGDVSADMFSVKVTKQGFFAGMNTEAEREVVDAYISDDQGNKVKGKSKYVTIEMSVDPAKDETNPFHYDFMETQRNTWASPYTHVVELVAGKKIQIGKTVYSKLDCTKQTKIICPELNDVTETVATYADIELRYASYAPEKLKKDKVKNALIIWLHGMGEGGADIRINTLGNRVTGLWQDEVQKCFDGNGAYVLAPQSPTMWMDDGSNELSTGAKASMYSEALWQLITEYVKANDDIDPNRIIIGGCSNGGYMTMNMLLLHPDYFAAAYPTCEAYEDKYITDAQIDAIKNVPIWFTHAKNDPTVNPETFTVATYNRLVAAGAKNVHFTFWDDVRDLSGKYKNEDGSAYSHNGHYSWIYVLNNACAKDFNGSNVQLNGKDVTLWQWLAAQHK